MSLADRVRLRPSWEWMTVRTIHDAVRIEAESCPRPWGLDEMMAFLRLDGCVARVATVDGKIAGFICYELCNSGSVEVVNLAVDPRYRRRGIGRYLMGFTSTRHQAWASVSEMNLPACLFLRAIGWRAVGILHGVSGDVGRDLIRFTHHAEGKR